MAFGHVLSVGCLIPLQFSQIIRQFLGWQYASICRGEHSLITRLEAAGLADWPRYLGFYSLRAWDELRGTPVTELIYIHSKLAIIDDNTVICGKSSPKK